MGRLSQQLNPVTPGRGRLAMQLGQAPQEQGTPGLLGFGKGILKGAGSTLYGAAQLADKIIPGRFTKDEKPEMFKPKGTAEKVGFYGEQIAEFFVPAGLAAKAVKGTQALVAGTKIGKAAQVARNLELAGETLTKGQKLAKIGAGTLRLAGRSAVGAAEAAGVTAIQTGGDKEATKTAAIWGGAIPIVMSGLGGAYRKIAKPVANKIETIIIKPTAADIKDGFKIDNVFKYDLAGTLSHSAEKVNERLSALSAQLKKGTVGTGVKVNILNEIDELERALSSTKSMNFGVNTRLQKSIQFLRDELGAITKDGIVDLGDAQQIKRGVGKLGAWQFGVRDPDANALEVVANQLYSRLRVLIEKSSPSDLHSINKAISELIPIENAIIRRLPVAERNAALSLTDAITGTAGFINPSTWWLTVLNRLSKSGTIAKYLERSARVPGERGAIGTVLQGSPQRGFTPPTTPQLALPYKPLPQGGSLNASPIPLPSVPGTVQEAQELQRVLQQRGLPSKPVARFIKPEDLSPGIQPVPIIRPLNLGGPKPQLNKTAILRTPQSKRVSVTGGSKYAKNIPVRNEAFGVFTGIEVDDNGKLKFNPQKAAAGVIGVAAIKSKQGQKILEVLKGKSAIPFKESAAKITEKSVQKTAKDMAKDLSNQLLRLIGLRNDQYSNGEILDALANLSDPTTKNLKRAQELIDLYGKR